MNSKIYNPTNVDITANNLLNDWSNLSKHKFNLLNNHKPQNFNTKYFFNTIKNTHQYFTKLNTIDNLPMYDKNNICVNTCFHIINLINDYCNNKTINAECCYDDINDLINYPLAKLQITIKASQLIALGLLFEISKIPNKKLNNLIAIIYNGETIYYDIKINNINEIINAVALYPYCEY
ncbi:MAG: hypothetical protein J6Q51_02265 [Clostridia bacterium]|nr:hypothetical protein [Clostridia bacterium]